MQKFSRCRTPSTNTTTGSALDYTFHSSPDLQTLPTILNPSLLTAAFLLRCMHCMQRGLATRKLSVRLLICNLWQNERKLCADFYTIWKNIYPSFRRRRKLVGATPSTWNFGSNWNRWSEVADFQSIFARSASAVTPSKKVQSIRIGSPLSAF